MAQLDVDDLMLCVSGIGSTNTIEEKRVYVPGEECLACLNDLQRYLRRDNPKEMAAHKQLGEWAVAKMHLLPMLLSQAHDGRLVFNLLKILVKLTMPIPPEAADARLQDAIDAHKEAFAACPDAVRVIMRLLVDPLRRSASGGAEAESENVFIELVLTLFRNLMHTPPPDSSPPGAAQAHAFRQSLGAHARILAVLEAEDVLEVVLYVTQLLSESSATRSWNLMLLEVVYCIVSFTEPDEVLAKARAHDGARAGGARERAPAGTRAPEAARAPARAGAPRLAELLKREQAARVATLVSSTVRHSNFGGAYANQSAFGAEAVVGRVQRDGAAALAEASKRKRLTKARAPLLEGRGHVSVGAARASGLLKFAARMLGGPLGALALTVRKDLVDAAFGSTAGNARRVLPADYVYFAAVSAWFCDVHRALELSRLSRARADGAAAHFEVAPVAASCELPCWQLALRLAREHLEAKAWLKLGVIIRYLRALVQVVDEMAARGDGEARRVARALFQNVFYEGEMVALLREVLRAYEPYHMGVSYLRDAIELTHVTLRQLESYGKEQGGIVLQKRRARRKRRGEAAARAAEAARVEARRAAVERARLDAVEAGASADETAAMVARAELEADMEAAAAAAAALADAVAGVDAPRADGDGDGDGDDDEEGVDVAVLEEVALDFERQLAELTTNQVVWKYCLALKGWRTNPPAVNHCVAKFLHRVMRQCNLEPVLWQLSVLQIAHAVLEHRDARERAEFNEVRALCDRIARRFLDAAARSPLLVVEALFWKRHAECEELRGGYANARQRAADRQAFERAAQQRAVFGDDGDDGVARDGAGGAHEAGGGGGSGEAGDGDDDDDGDRDWKPDLANSAEDGAADDDDASGDDARAQPADRGARAPKGSAPRNRAPWSADEDATLALEYELWAEHEHAYELVAERLDERSAKDVRRRVRKLGLRKAARARARARGAHADDGVRVPLVVAGGEEGSSDDDDDAPAPKRRAGGLDGESGAREANADGGAEGHGDPFAAPHDGDPADAIDAPSSPSSPRAAVGARLSAARTERKSAPDPRIASDDEEPLYTTRGECGRLDPAKRDATRADSGAPRVEPMIGARTPGATRPTALGSNDDDDHMPGEHEAEDAERRAAATPAVRELGVADDDSDDDAEMDALLAAAAGLPAPATSAA